VLTCMHIQNAHAPIDIVRTSCMKLRAIPPAVWALTAFFETCGTIRSQFWLVQALQFEAKQLLTCTNPANASCVEVASLDILLLSTFVLLLLCIDWSMCMVPRSFHCDKNALSEYSPTKQPSSRESKKTFVNSTTKKPSWPGLTRMSV
jgi:hypothetical protein